MEPSQRKISCPRCGYDQSGLIETWKDACPLNGTCSECGLEFAWTDLFNADKKLLPDFVEHSRIGFIGLKLAGAAWRTWSWTILPWRFWRRVKLHHPIRPRRWVAWILLIFVVMHLVIAGLQIGAILSDRSYAIAPGGRFGVASKTAPWSTSEVMWVIAEGLSRPLVDVGEFKYAAAMKSAGGPLVMPGPGGWIPRAHWLPDRARWFAVGGLMMSLAFPIMLALLPDTRRVSKVRMAHVWRAFVYSLAWLVLPMSLVLLRAFGDLIYGAGTSWRTAQRTSRPFFFPDRLTLDRWDAVILFAIVIWLAAWWLTCIRQGLKLKRALTVWTVLMVPVMLSVIVAVVSYAAFWPKIR